MKKKKEDEKEERRREKMKEKIKATRENEERLRQNEMKEKMILLKMFEHLQIRQVNWPKMFRKITLERIILLFFFEVQNLTVFQLFT